MAHVSVYYVPENLLSPGPELTEMGRRLWLLGMPFLESADFGELPEDGCEVELIYEGMGIAFSALGDPVPNSITDLRCPKCEEDVLHAAYEAWGDEESALPTGERRFACPHCAAEVTGASVLSEEPFTFATSYLFVSEIDPDYWPAQAKVDIEGIVGPCREFREFA